MPFSKFGYNRDSSGHRLSAPVFLVCFQAGSTAGNHVSYSCVCEQHGVCETQEYLTGRVTKHSSGPPSAAQETQLPTRVPSQPLPPRLPFLPSQTPNTHHQMQSPKGSARCPVLSINKRLPQYGNLSNRIVSGFCTKELSVLQVAGSQPVPRQQYCSKHQGLRSEPSFVLYKLTARHHARQ